MKIGSIILLGLLLSARSGAAELQVETLGSSDQPLVSALHSLSKFPYEPDAPVNKAPYRAKDVQLLVLDTSAPDLNLTNQEVLMRIKKADNLVLIGTPNDTMRVSKVLLGYAIFQGLVTIHHPGDPRKLTLTTYRHREDAAPERLARAVVDSAIQSQMH